VSDLEASFDTHWRILGGPLLTPEHAFAPPRKWRFDRAHLMARVCIELDGGTHNGGRHVRGEGYAKDCEKLNAATAQGWAVFRLTSDMLRDDPEAHLQPIIDKINDLLDDPPDESEI
jgi:very-short-patch-repair endonuclease